MPLLTVNNLGFSHGATVILADIAFSIEPGERVGLVGRNGTGKTTLFRCITGEYEPTVGEVHTTKGSRIGYLTQDPKFDGELTVFQAAECAFAELHQVHEKLDQVADHMADADGNTLDRLMKKYERLEQQMESLGGYAVEHRIEETLHGLGFTDAQFTQNVKGLSGGERSRLALVQLLLEDPDLLLLDEPTNHLDIDGRRWLETFLTETFRGAVLVVSHDRYLLDRVIVRILETEVNGSISSYPGNYATFRKQRYERKLTQQREFDKQQDHVRREKDFIRRYKAGQRSKQASGRESRLERYQGTMTERPLELDDMKLNLPKASRSGDMVLKVESLSKSFGDRVLFHDFSFTISRGDRIGIIGPNGAGKSTLINCLLGEVDSDEGITRLGSNVSIGYFSQMHKDLRMDYTVWQHLNSVIKSLDGQAKASEQQSRDLAGAFLFSGNDQEKTLDLLSGGERARVILAGLVAGGHNLLILDEPTNHFDIPSAERLEKSLNAQTGFDGTVVIISHDRAFLDACVDQLIVLDGEGNLTHTLGNYQQWRERTVREEQEAIREEAALAQELAREESRKKKQDNHASTKGKKGSASGSSKNPPNARRSGSTQKRTGTLSKWSFEKLESRIESIEKRVAEIDEAFMQSDVQRDGNAFARLTSERADLLEEKIPLEFEWSQRA